MRLSYAQNLEDYHLDLAFAGHASGTYVDVGGGHPVADNVSFWFYLKGWRGLIVEPQAELADAYRHVRPRDVVFQGLAGGSDGDVDFHIVEGLHGLSSMIKPASGDAMQPAVTFRTEQRPVRRLDRLVAEAGLGQVDFLKIDVEGAERQVLAGIDFAKLRPRMLVIEAINPGNLAGDASAWEPSLLAAGYEFCLFDRLNRFYVAREASELRSRLPAEPAPWDRVAHLWDEGRAPEKSAHIDHALARTLVHGLMALLPGLDAGLIESLLRQGLKHPPGGDLSGDHIARLLGKAEYPGREPVPQTITALLASDRFRAALGRVACMYDGGHIVDEPSPEI